MRHGALFNGIGGFQLAAHWIGWENVFHCEIDKFCNRVVKKHFPESICYEDIKQTDFTAWRGTIDIITGGFPCQPYSRAGKRKGNLDDRHLWPQMLRAIGEVRPRWVVGENVPGLVDWGKGMVFQQIQTDLETEGYEVFPPLILPACGKEAPHERSRLWIIAHTKGDGQNGSMRFGKDGQETSDSKDEAQEQRLRYDLGRNGQEAITSDSHISGLSRRIQRGKWGTSKENEQERGGESARIYTAPDWSEFPTESPLFDRNDGLSERVAGIRAAGNAIVPRIALEIFKAVESYEQIISLPNRKSI